MTSRRTVEGILRTYELRRHAPVIPKGKRRKRPPLPPGLRQKSNRRRKRRMAT